MELLLEERIEKRKRDFHELYQKRLEEIARQCVNVWSQSDQLDHCLLENLDRLANCRMLYAINCNGTQISSNIQGNDHIDKAARGQDLSKRPYIKSKNQQESFIFSPVYINRINLKPCITALQQVVNENNAVIGCIAADFQIDDIDIHRHDDALPAARQYWRQIKGDPAIRQNLFQQQRVSSAMDQKIEQVHGIINNLMTKRGIFHAKLHYSSSRATLWPYETPYEYKLHVLDEIINPEVCLAYAKQPYPDNAKVDAKDISSILKRFVDLRNADNTLYLRAGSLNVMNSLVGLNFSCDGSHYMPVDEFLDKPLCFWLG